MWVLFDGNYLLHRVLHLPAYRTLRLPDGRFTGGLYGVLTSLSSTLSFVSATHAVWVWDGAHSQRRKQLYPEYKEGRKVPDDPDFDFRAEFRASRALIDRFLVQLGVRTIRFKTREADDVLFRLCRNLRKAETPTRSVVVSDDRDMLQMVSSRCAVYRPHAREWVKRTNLEERTGARNRSEFLFLKAMQGDKSDNITGVPGIGKIRAERLLRSLQPLIDEARVEWEAPLCMRVAIDRASTTDNWAARTRKNWKTVLRNLELVDMSREVFEPEEEDFLRGLLESAARVTDRATLKEDLQQLSMNSLLSDFQSWIRPFMALR